MTGGGWREREGRKEEKLWLICKMDEKITKTNKQKTDRKTPRKQYPLDKQGSQRL